MAQNQMLVKASDLTFTSFHTAYLEVVYLPSDKLVKFFHFIAVANTTATASEFFHSLLKHRY